VIRVTDPAGRGRRKPTRSSPEPADIFPTFDEIARRAHEIYIAERRDGVSRLDCWLRAEDELLDQEASRATRGPADP